MSSQNAIPPRKTILILFTALVIDMLAFTCILPLFPSILNYYAQEDKRDFLYNTFDSGLKWFQNALGVPENERYNNVFFGGLLGSLFSALQFVSAPTMGALSDHYGRRSMLLVCGLGTLLSYFMWQKAETFTIFVLSRIIGGLSKSNINVASAIVADIYEPVDHPKGQAFIGLSYSIGFLIGPMIGAYFSTIAPQGALFTTPATFAIYLATIQLFIIYMFLPETLSFDKMRSEKETREKIKKLVVSQEIFIFSAVNAPVEKRLEMQKYGKIYFIYLFLYAGLEFTLPFLTHLRFDFNSMQQGRLYLFCGLIMLPIQGYYVRKTPMHRQKKIAEYGIMFIVPAYLIVSMASSVWSLYFGLTFYAIASATVVPGLSSCMTAIHPTSDKGTITGVFRSIGALARALGPIFASTLFWLLGASTCYTIGGILLLAPLILLRRCNNPLEEAKKEN